MWRLLIRGYDRYVFVFGGIFHLEWANQTVSFCANLLYTDFISTLVLGTMIIVIFSKVILEEALLYLGAWAKLLAIAPGLKLVPLFLDFLHLYFNKVFDINWLLSFLLYLLANSLPHLLLVFSGRLVVSIDRHDVRFLRLRLIQYNLYLICTW